MAPPPACLSYGDQLIVAVGDPTLMVSLLPLTVRSTVPTFTFEIAPWNAPAGGACARASCETSDAAIASDAHARRRARAEVESRRSRAAVLPRVAFTPCT